MVFIQLASMVVHTRATIPPECIISVSDLQTNDVLYYRGYGAQGDLEPYLFTPEATAKPTPLVKPLTLPKALPQHARGHTASGSAGGPDAKTSVILTSLVMSNTDLCSDIDIAAHFEPDEIEVENDKYKAQHELHYLDDVVCPRCSKVLRAGTVFCTCGKDVNLLLPTYIREVQPQRQRSHFEGVSAKIQKARESLTCSLPIISEWATKIGDTGGSPTEDIPSENNPTQESDLPPVNAAILPRALCELCPRPRAKVRFRIDGKFQALCCSYCQGPGARTRRHSGICDRRYFAELEGRVL